MSTTGRSVPRRTKVVTQVKLMTALDEYWRAAEEHEDDDVIRDTSVEGRLNDFAMWLYHSRFKTA